MRMKAGCVRMSVAVLLSGLWLGPALAAEPGCLDCHDEPQLLDSRKGPHGPRPAHAGDAECSACHGSSLAHQRRPERGQSRALPDVVFPPRPEDPKAASAVCLDCHRGSERMHWPGSAHAEAGLACSDCHRVHAPDPMRDRSSENEACFTCHARQRSEHLMPSAHPLRDGRMACSDCHQPHGSIGPALLKAATVNDTCYTCHAEQRGPFLWEHPPVAEDCLSCHRPHGSPQRALLTQRTPWLCQQCHLAQFHPSTALSGTGLPGPTTPSGSSSLLGRDCMNCHGQVHGSNHPSGAGATR